MQPLAPASRSLSRASSFPGKISSSGNAPYEALRPFGVARAVFHAGNDAGVIGVQTAQHGRCYRNGGDLWDVIEEHLQSGIGDAFDDGRIAAEQPLVR